MTQTGSAIWRTVAYGPNHRKLPTGLDAAWSAWTGLLQRIVPRCRRFLARSERVLALEKTFAELSDARLRAEVEPLRDVFCRGRETVRHVDRAFALIREIADRQVGLRPFPVQLAGALALDAGCVVEMATGEGKTLVATMPATLAGWRGRGCHVITVNDYLARRDAEWMRKVYEFCGLRVAYIEQEMQAGDRRAAYQADITYCTNKEVTADFLRDRLALGRLRGLAPALLATMDEGRGSGADRLVQRGLHYAIVDEADSVLIDEAVTPLIISGDAPNPQQVESFRQAADLGEQLEAGKDYRIDSRYREITLTNAGKQRLVILSESLGGVWAGALRREELVHQALTARHFYRRDAQYVIDEGKVIIVDEFTGRLMPDRTWRDGLHQAIEAREGLIVNPPKETYARISFQRFFRMYRKLCGMTGTALEGTSEFWQIYNLPVVRIPTHRPCVRKQFPDRVFATETAKWQVIVEEIAGLHQAGRPVLVGIRSVQASESLSRELSARQLPHQVLNAVRHAEEARIIASAGQAGQITVATNMAGRGTDIKLGRGVAERDGLHVLATERHEAGRVDRQLYGRAARQGDPGSAQAIVSLEDELVRRYATHASALLRKRFTGTNREISSPLTWAIFAMAQRRAERLAMHRRKSVLRTDDWLDEYLGFAGREV